MSLAATFEGIARQMAAQFGGPYHPATIRSARPVLDAGGSVASSPAATPVSVMAQLDACTDAMRRDQGYQDRDVRLIILADAAPIIGSRVTMTDGPAPGTYSIESVDRDPAGIGYSCRARPA